MVSFSVKYIFEMVNNLMYDKIDNGEVPKVKLPSLSSFLVA